ncbi:2 3-bisphosphoglycerate-dependent phosphoglycerate mutase [Coprobacillus sp. CAG:698]|nr:2 3-bisphosphoglycerate-dependent phosphoglycerate mutase [Coprobacillus sp. CAG:698]
MKLVILRHGESLWNLENRFTGWTDVELSENGKIEAAKAGKILKEKGYDFDICFTSYLKRAIHTLDLVLTEMDRSWLPVIKNHNLNERHYGALQGLNKSETAQKYGDEQVLIWRRSYDVRPPLLENSDERNPANQTQYRDINKDCLPLGESLEDTVKRTIPYFEKEIMPLIKEGKRVIIVAHGNSLRALIMHLEHLTSEQIMKVNLPTGIPLVYEFDGNMQFKSKYYLGDEEFINSKIQAVANQGKKK